MSDEDDKMPSGVTRDLYLSSCFIFSVSSLFFQLIFVVVCQKLKGWRSNFAFYLLQTMAILSSLTFLNQCASYIQAIFLFESLTFSKIIGSNYIHIFSTFVLTNICLTLHRFLYTLFPLKAQHALSEPALKACLCLIFIFYITFTCFGLVTSGSPVFCPYRLDYYFLSSAYAYFYIKLNRISNYLVGVVNVSAYAVIFVVLYLRGTLTFKRNCEIRMTLNAAVVSFCEMLFFLSWEYISALCGTFEVMFNEYSMLLYYDILILPYFIMNKNVKAEVRSIFCGRSTVVVSIIGPSSKTVTGVRSRRSLF